MWFFKVFPNIQLIIHDNRVNPEVDDYQAELHEFLTCCRSLSNLKLYDVRICCKLRGCVHLYPFFSSLSSFVYLERIGWLAGPKTKDDFEFLDLFPHLCEFHTNLAKIEAALDLIGKMRIGAVYKFDFFRSVAWPLIGYALMVHRKSVDEYTIFLRKGQVPHWNALGIEEQSDHLISIDEGLTFNSQGLTNYFSRPDRHGLFAHWLEN